MRENKMKKIRIAAAGDNCMDALAKETPGSLLTFLFFSFSLQIEQQF